MCIICEKALQAFYKFIMSAARILRDVAENAVLGQVIRNAFRVVMILRIKITFYKLACAHIEAPDNRLLQLYPSAAKWVDARRFYSFEVISEKIHGTGNFCPFWFK